MAFRQPCVAVVRGLGVGEEPEAVGTVLDGSAVSFESDVEPFLNVGCSTNAIAHEKDLAEIKRMRKGAA
jgi:hypothetical protein